MWAVNGGDKRIMEPGIKGKRRAALLLVRENGDGSMQQRLISSAAINAAAVVLFLLIVAVICKFVYDSITIKNAREELIQQSVTINNLTDENEALTVENDALNSKVSVLSETVSKKAATEDALSQETVENALPKGFPLSSGLAPMEEVQDGEPMLVFSASEGINVVTTGTGVVVSVDADETYGTKVVIDHGNGYQSIYRNNAQALVKNGEELGKGYILFTVGKDNKKLGYQIVLNDEYIDPMQMIDING